MDALFEREEITHMKKPNGCLKALIVLVVLFVIGFGILFLFVSNLFSKMHISDVNRYEEEYKKRDIQKFELFPESIPDSATDVKFSSTHGLQSHEGGFYLEMTLPEEEFNNLIEDYELFIPEQYGQYPQYVRDFVQDQKGFEVYSDYENGRGFIIDRDANRILYFYDEYTCGNN